MTCTFFTALHYKPSNKNAHKGANHFSAPVLSTVPSILFKGMKSQEMPRNFGNADLHNSTFTEGHQLEDDTASQKPSLHENPALDRETDAWSTSRLDLGMSKEPQDQKETIVTHTMYTKVPVLSSTRVPHKPPVTLTEAKELEKTFNPLSNSTTQNQTSLTFKNSTIERTWTKVNIQAAKPNALHGLKNNTPPNLFTSRVLNHAVSTRLPFLNSREPVKLTDISSVKVKMHINPFNRSEQKGAIKDLLGGQFMTQNPQFQTSSNKSIFLNNTSPIRPLIETLSALSSSTLFMPIFKSPTLPKELTLPSKFPTLQYKGNRQQVPLLQPFSEKLEPQLDHSVPVSTIKPLLFQTKVPLSTFTLLQSVTSYPNPLVQKNPIQTEGQNQISQTPTSGTPHMSPWSQALIQKNKPKTQTPQWKQIQMPITRLTSASRSAQKLTLGKGFTQRVSPTMSETISSTHASMPSASPSILGSSQQLSAAVPVSSLAFPRSTSLAKSKVQNLSSSTSKAHTVARLPNLPTPSPISTPPYITPSPLPVAASSTLPPLSLSRSPAHVLSISVSSSSLPPKLSSSVTSSYASPFSSFTIPQSIFSIDSASPSSSFSSSSIPNSTSSSSISSQNSASSYLASSPSPNSYKTTSRHPRPSPHNHHLTSTLATLTPQPPTKTFLIHVTSLEPDPEPNVPTPGILHSPPKVHPNFDQNLKANLDNKVKPNPTQIDNNLKDPSSTPVIPVMEGKYPDIIPRNSTWVLGMLLGCSACLGMIVVVGLRYMCHQVCSKRTEVTLNDREREYGRGERGLIHVQECGDLVRVRRIRDNSFVLLAEYDILASAGD